ncbi:MAG: GspE/PulE family protein [Candidatus Gracilibacteria bacterium]|nr:GspE/PulE family protein [Candidatus Gracilibacteria bacterium]
MPLRNDLGDVVDYTNKLFDFALETNSSDIHIEPTKNFITLRFRQSGDFLFVDKISHEEYNKLLSRIKILANMRIDEKHKPQDGKIAFTSEKIDNELVDIRVSIIPIVDGEKIVMRILRQNTNMLSLEKLDFLDVNLEKIKKSLASKYGMILVAGPTGSGKSTTLFSMLNSFDPLAHNITTLEDPVEYNIPHINQTQVKPQIGFDFASGLRAIVRQDPDIIMVGEIRDKETAMLAIEAALTGHLVLSTIHTNSAAGTIQRLINMDIEPFLISSALKMVISQRLVKKLCPHCGVPQKITDPVMQSKVSGYLSHIIEDNVADIDFYKAVGCEKCDSSGFSGRMGTHEVLVMDEALDPLILHKAPVHEIEQKARELGMITIMQDGLIKAATGKTTVEEIMKLI